MNPEAIKYYDAYLDVFENLFGHREIFSKDYNTTIVRNILIYFLYKHYKNKQIQREDIQSLFKIKHINSIHNKIKNVSENIDNPNFLLKKKEIFRHFFFIFQKVYANLNNNNLNT